MKKEKKSMEEQRRDEIFWRRGRTVVDVKCVQVEAGEGRS